MSRSYAAAARDERGFTMIEVLFAALVISVGLIAVFGALDSSDRLTRTARYQNIALSQGEGQMELLRSTRYADLGLTSLPTSAAAGNPANDPTPTNPSNPNYWVRGSDLKIVQNFSSMTSPTLPTTNLLANGEEALISSASGVAPTKTFNVGNVTGTVYTYVTWVDENCSLVLLNLCPTTQDAKRLTVAVKVDSTPGSGPQKPIWFSSVVANPGAGS